MSGNSVMYAVKPYYEHDRDVELPTVMYKMKNIHREAKNGPTTDYTSMDPVSALEKRQDAIFTRLDALRQKLNKLKGKYELPSATSAAAKSSHATVSPKQNSGTPVSQPLGSGIHDIVINADPDKPPLSVFILFELLKQRYSVLATSYVHSSVSSVNPALVDMIKNGCQVTRGSHQLALSVVWKKVENGPELMVSPARQSCVTGEVNIARYINRLLSPAFDTDDIVMATTADEWLDTADLQILNGNSKQRNAALKSLNNRLKKNDWLVGDQFSVVDAVTWSALHQTELAKSAAESVQKWISACNGMPGFSAALSLLS